MITFCTINGRDKITSTHDVCRVMPCHAMSNFLVTGRKDVMTAFAKVVVLKTDRNKVLGLHLASPNAGEIIQVTPLIQPMIS